MVQPLIYVCFSICVLLSVRTRARVCASLGPTGERRKRTGRANETEGKESTEWTQSKLKREGMGELVEDGNRKTYECLQFASTDCSPK